MSRLRVLQGTGKMERFNRRKHKGLKRMKAAAGRAAAAFLARS